MENVIGLTGMPDREQMLKCGQTLDSEKFFLGIGNCIIFFTG